MCNKELEYKERHVRWQNTAITQFGFTNNIIFTISIGFLSFALDKETLSELSFSSDAQFSFGMLLNVIIVLVLLLSIFYAVITAISRLYDFRISRHIAYVRYKHSKEINSSQSLPQKSFKNPFFIERIVALCTICFMKMDLIPSDQIKTISENPKLMERFCELRRLSHYLGVMSWKYMKMQILFLFVALIIYSINLFISA